MNVLYIPLIILSGVSFIIYGGFIFKSSKMQIEFTRFGLEKFAKLTGFLEILGGIGMLVGIKFGIILLISSGGLAILMLLGLGVRLKIKDGFWLFLPALFFMLLNLYIFIATI